MARYHGLCDSASHPLLEPWSGDRYLVDLFLRGHDLNCALCLNRLFLPISSAFTNSSRHETIEVEIG